MSSQTFKHFLVGINITLTIFGFILVKKLKNEKHRYKKLYEVSKYLLSVADEQDIDISEFDLIALNILIQEN